LTLDKLDHEFSLEAGTRYVASRPIATRGREVYPVSIKAAGHADPDVVISNLSYDEANELLDAFNNGVTSFEGRVW
jgi:hypothetical protein